MFCSTAVLPAWVKASGLLMACSGLLVLVVVLLLGLCFLFGGLVVVCLGVGLFVGVGWVVFFVVWGFGFVVLVFVLGLWGWLVCCFGVCFWGCCLWFFCCLCCGCVVLVLWLFVWVVVGYCDLWGVFVGFLSCFGLGVGWGVVGCGVGVGGVGWSGGRGGGARAGGGRARAPGGGGGVLVGFGGRRVGVGGGGSAGGRGGGGGSGLVGAGGGRGWGGGKAAGGG
ncbi:hypothetical protein, partial [Pseudomonas syringae group genomosp. 7]|uniref:hypothetical protein n=1 Tax=Pseudomonas syringae group genomosp. 7 TaxID=251699 RepID=UPI0037707253